MKIVITLNDGTKMEVDAVREFKVVDQQGNVRYITKQTRFGILTESAEKKLYA